jgi:uncharacterized membrane protein
MRALAVVIVLGSVAAPARADESAARGLGLLADKGCLGCHSADGTARVGPSFLGLYGSRVELTGGTSSTVDDDYLARAIREPNAELRRGFPANTMPVLDVSDDELAAMLAAFHQLAEPDVVRERERREGSLWMLIAGALLFVVGHLAMSAHPVRRRLVARLGDGAFQGIYSLVAIAGLTFLIWGWIRAPYIAVWVPQLWTRHVPLAVMPVALILVAGAFTNRNPTSVGQEKVLADQTEPRGAQTITRHPMLWGFLLWALAHVPPNGDLATLILLGSIAALSIGGMIHIDRRRARAMGDDWKAFADQTSLVPFAAVVRGRTRLDLAGLVAPIVVGAGLYAVLLFGHAWLIGVSALPY